MGRCNQNNRITYKRSQAKSSKAKNLSKQISYISMYHMVVRLPNKGKEDNIKHLFGTGCYFIYNSCFLTIPSVLSFLSNFISVNDYPTHVFFSLLTDTPVV